MEVVVRNNLRIRGADPELRQYLKALLTLENPKWLEAKAFNRSTAGIPREISQYQEDGEDILLPRGILYHLLEDLGRDFEVLDERISPAVEAPWPEPNCHPRPGDQEPAIRELLAHDNGFLTAGAGAGKTICGLEACRRSGLRALWLTHQKELLKQTSERAQGAFNIPKKQIGILHGRKWRIGPQLTIGMAPTLRSRDLSELLPLFGIVIVDEAHHVPSSTFLQIVGEFPAARLYGLTATAYRSDKLENIMFNAIGPIVSRIQTEDLFRDEHLIKPTVRRRLTHWLPPKAHDMGYHDLMAAMVEAPERNRLIARDVLAQCRSGNSIIVLTERTKHAEILTQLLKEGGARCEFLVGAVDVFEKDKRGKKIKKSVPLSMGLRQKLVSDFKQGEIQVLVATYDLLAEGFDHPPLNCLFLASPVKWRGTVIQAIGRVQRPWEGKTGAMVWDYIDDDIPMFGRQADTRFFEVYEPMALPIEDA